MESAQHHHCNTLGSLCPHHVSLYQLQLIVRRHVGPEMPTVGTMSFSESIATAPIACLFMCGERLPAGDWAEPVCTVGFARTHCPAGCHNGCVILAIKQLKVKCQEKGRATINHHPIKCYNLLLSHNLFILASSSVLFSQFGGSHSFLRF